VARAKQFLTVTAVLSAMAIPMLGLPAFGATKNANCKDTMGRFIPADVWVFESTWHDPQRDFLSEHWGRVWNSVKNSGVFNEFFELVSSDMSADQKAEVDAFFDKATRLVTAVNWGDLIENEMAFGSRFSNVVPEFMFLFDAAADTRDANATGLADIFAALSDVSSDIVLTQEDYEGAKVWRLAFADTPIVLLLAQKDNVIGLFMGEDAMRDCLNLMAGKSKKNAIVNTDRFQNALAKVPAPTFSVSFIDMGGLFAFINRFPDMIATEHGHTNDPESQQWLDVAKAVIDEFDMFEYVMVTGTMDGTKEFVHSFIATKPGGQNKACMKMCTGQRKFDNFEKFVPKSAKGFQMSAGFDFSVMYDRIEQFVRTKVPEGDAHWNKWERIQTDAGFSVRADLLDWISGEFVSVKIPSTMQSPFGSSDQGVMMLRVSDPEKAQKQIDRVINWIDGQVSDGEKPGLMIADAKSLPVEGFRNVTHPMIMMMLRPCLGVWNDWLVFGTNEQSVADVINTYSGDAENITANPRFVAEGLSPTGPVYGVSFTDLDKLSQELGQVSMMMGMMGAFIPNEPETKPVRAMMNMFGKLGPVFMELNFFSSTSSVTRLENDGWSSTLVTVYKTADEIKQTTTKPQ